MRFLDTIAAWWLRRRGWWCHRTKTLSPAESEECMIWNRAHNAGFLLGSHCSDIFRDAEIRRIQEDRLQDPLWNGVEGTNGLRFIRE